jgi:hypothetical protein
MRYLLQLRSDERRPAQGAHVAALTQFNDDLWRAGVLLAVEGLLPSARGAHISMARGQRTIVEGQRADPRPTSAGFWLIQADSAQTAVAWAKRCPLADGDELELRELYEPPELWTVSVL